MSRASAKATSGLLAGKSLINGNNHQVNFVIVRRGVGLCPKFPFEEERKSRGLLTPSTKRKRERRRKRREGEALVDRKINR